MLPGSPQSLRRLWLAAGWAGVAIVVFYTLKPDPPDLGIDQSDKLLHLAAYCGLMGWFAQVRTLANERLVTGAALAAMGIALEFAQGQTGYRTFSVADMAANAAGVLLGWVAAPPRLPSVFEWVRRRLAPS